MTEDILFKSGDFYPGDWGFFQIWGFLSPGYLALGIRDFLNLGIFIPGIRDFSKFGDFYPRGLRIFLKSRNFYTEDWEFFKICGLLSPGFFGDGDFSRMGIFFRRIPTISNL